MASNAHNRTTRHTRSDESIATKHLQPLTTTDTSFPKVWLVLGDKLGDNAQVHIIADALGWPYEIKKIVFRERYKLGKPRFKPSLYHIDGYRSDALEPPWPDLIITIGRRPSMAALWIHGQSGGHTKLVLIGRPKRWLDRFDLVITPTQYLLPDLPNILHLNLPLMRSDETAIAHAAKSWNSRFDALPRPVIALLIGGPTQPFIFDEEVAKRLISTAERVADEAGGTLYITTSRRTPATVIGALKEVVPKHAILYEWNNSGVDNPYLALLGHADRFIVTGDSISMMVEVARLGKPLAIFPLPMTRLGRLRRFFGKFLHPSPDANKQGGFLRSLGDALFRFGIIGYSRDLTAIHRALIERQLAVPLGNPFHPPGRKPIDELPQVVARVRALMA